MMPTRGANHARGALSIANSDLQDFAALLPENMPVDRAVRLRLGKIGKIKAGYTTCSWQGSPSLAAARGYADVQTSISVIAGVQVEAGAERLLMRFNRQSREPLSAQHCNLLGQVPRHYSHCLRAALTVAIKLHVAIWQHMQLRKSLIVCRENMLTYSSQASG